MYIMEITFLLGVVAGLALALFLVALGHFSQKSSAFVKDKLAHAQLFTPEATIVNVDNPVEDFMKKYEQDNV